MRWFAIAALVVSFATVSAGCGRTPVHDCQTAGGLYVRHAECDAELEQLQGAIEAAAEGLGYRPNVLAGVVMEVRPDGWKPDSGVGLNMGITYCDGPEVIVVKGPNVPWRLTSLAHEAFHIAQNCIWDRVVEAECLVRPYKPGEYRDCGFEAQHPHWTVAIQPVIQQLAEEP